jgi:hypothetical protein
MFPFHSIATSCELKAGEEGKKLELKNSDKEIRNVTFVYRAMPNSGTAFLLLHIILTWK